VAARALGVALGLPFLTLGDNPRLVFERFTPRARQVVVLAQEEARAFKQDHIGTEHLLLGLLGAGDGVAASVLAKLGVGFDRVRERASAIVGPGDQTFGGRIPFAPQTKKVLEKSLREAMNLGHSYLGTEHILLALVDENDSVAVRILRDFDVEPEAVRRHVIRVVTSPGYKSDLSAEASAATVRASPAVFDEWLGPALQAAQAEADKRGDARFDSGDLVLGLILDHSSVAERGLSSLGVSADALREALVDIRGGSPGSDPPDEAGPTG
jgi:ATP-dependent Clp protease ATP-binding subunit ClpA